MVDIGANAILTERGPAVLAEEPGDVVGDTLGTCEDEDLVVLVIHDTLKVLAHLVTLLEVRNNLHDLGDAVVGRKVHGTDVDLDEVGLVIRGKLANLLGPRSRPHASLTVRANLADDLPDLRLKTHVEHTVSLIEDEVGDTPQVGLARLEHVNQTAGSGNADLDTASKVTDLTTLGHTTVHASVPDARGLAELADLSLDLDSKLTGGSENEDDGAVTGSKERLGVDVDDGRKTVGEGLSRTSLGDADNVASGESHGPALGLNGRGLLEALGLDLVHDITRETSLVECGDGLGNVGAVNGHLVLLAEFVDLLLGAGSDVGVLLVERLLELGKGAEIPVLLLQASTKVRHPVTTTSVAAAATTTITTAVSTTVSVATTVAAVGVAVATAVSARRMSVKVLQAWVVSEDVWRTHALRRTSASQEAPEVRCMGSPD